MNIISQIFYKKGVRSLFPERVHLTFVGIIDRNLVNAVSIVNCFRPMS
jgi:hypothetical protein